MIATIEMTLLISAAVIAALFSAHRAVRRPMDGLALIVLTLVIALPLWVTCDRYALKVLPTVAWFDPAEPFAPYFLLYLPLSIVFAVSPAAAAIVISRLCRPLPQDRTPTQTPEERSITWHECGRRRSCGL